MPAFEPSNSDRAAWAEEAVERHGYITNSISEPAKTQLADLLCNIHHLAKQEGYDLPEMLTSAAAMAEEEEELEEGCGCP